MSQAQFNVNLNRRTSDQVREGNVNHYLQDPLFTSMFDSSLADKTTDDVAEGANLYWTQGRFNTAFGAKTTADLAEGTNLYYTTARWDSKYTTARATAAAWSAVQTFSAGINVAPAAYTPDDESSAYVGIDNTSGGLDYATIGDLNALRTAYENLRAQVESIRTKVNA